jgi:hypothetical protein
MKGLILFSGTNVPTSWTVAAWHSPHSLTWRWSLTFSLFRADEWRVWPIFWRHRDNNGLQWTARIPYVGFLRFSQQRPMWYRDLYTRMRDERDGITCHTTPPPPRFLPPMVSDGGSTFH